MAVSLIATGANATGTTSLSVAYPTGVAANDLLVMYVVNKNSSITPTLPTGWTLLSTATAGTGADGTSTGLVRVTCYYLRTGSALTGSLTVAVPSANVSMGHMQLWRKSVSGVEYNVIAAAFSDATSDTTVGGTLSTFLTMNPGDAYSLITAQTNQVTMSAQTVTSTGATIGAATEYLDATSLTGNVISYSASTGSVTAGKSTGSTVITSTASAATTGGGYLLKISESNTNGAAIKNDADHFASGSTVVTYANSGNVAANNSQLVLFNGTSRAVSAFSAHGGISFGEDAVSGSQANLIFNCETPSRYISTREYLYLTGYPSTAIQWTRIENYNGTQSLARLIIQNTGVVGYQDFVGATPQTNTVPIPLNQWIRFEMRIDQGTTASNGVLNYAMYVGESKTPIDSMNLTNCNFGGANISRYLPVRVAFGKGSNAGSLALNYHDDIWVESNRTTEIGPVVPSSDVAGAVSITGVTSGQSSDFGNATGSVTVTGDATGSTSTNGSASGSVVITALTSGSVDKFGTSSGSVSIVGYGYGNKDLSGSSNGSVSVSAIVSGTKTSQGSISGSVSVTGLPSGTQQPSGSSTGSVSITGVPSGTAPTVGVNSGSASGTVTTSGVTTGATDKSGSSTGAVSVVSTSTGSTARYGSATGSVTITSTSTASRTSTGALAGSVIVSAALTGSKATSGSTNGSVASTGSTSGSKTSYGDVSGNVNAVGTVTGNAPVLSVPSGSASGSVSITTNVSGTVNKSGAVNASVTTSATLSGSRLQNGSAAGTVSINGSSTGFKIPLGSVSGVVQAGSYIEGTTFNSGSTAGTVLVTAEITVKNDSDVEIVLDVYLDTVELETYLTNPSIQVGLSNTELETSII